MVARRTQENIGADFVGNQIHLVVRPEDVHGNFIPRNVDLDTHLARQTFQRLPVQELLLRVFMRFQNRHENTKRGEASAEDRRQKFSETSTIDQGANILRT